MTRRTIRQWVELVRRAPTRRRASPLPAFISLLRARPMTAEETREQMISFAYGNAAIENPNVTRELVEEIAARLGI